MQTTENELYFTNKSHLDKTSYKILQAYDTTYHIPEQPLPNLQSFTYNQPKLWPIFP
jgi:hypothetical protein